MMKPMLGLSLQVSMPTCVHVLGACADAGAAKTSASNKVEANERILYISYSSCLSNRGGTGNSRKPAADSRSDDKRHRPPRRPPRLRLHTPLRGMQCGAQRPRKTLASMDDQ